MSTLILLQYSVKISMEVRTRANRLTAELAADIVALKVRAIEQNYCPI